MNIVGSTKHNYCSFPACTEGSVLKKGHDTQITHRRFTGTVRKNASCVKKPLRTAAEGRANDRALYFDNNIRYLEI